MIVQDYVNLITSEHSNRAKFIAMIEADVSPMVQVQSLLQSMIPLFDIDTPPIGNQLDIIGQWVGVTRYVNVPITGIFFSWDDVDATGWNMGVWQGTGPVNGVTALPDANYLTLIKAKIAANHWDGTTEGAYDIFSILFPDFTLLIQDNQNMTMFIIIQGLVLDSLTLALLVGGYLPLKPEGVRISAYIVPVDTNPLLGWDIENTYFQGWEVGSWGSEITA